MILNSAKEFPDVSQQQAEDTPGTENERRPSAVQVRNEFHIRAAHAKGHRLAPAGRKGFRCTRCERADGPARRPRQWAGISCQPIEEVEPRGVHESHMLSCKHGLWFCTHCWAWSVAREATTGRLPQPCRPPGRSGLAARNRIMKDQLPDRLTRWPDGSPPIVPVIRRGKRVTAAQ